MSKDRSDFAVMNRMIDHIRLLIAVDDEQIPVKKKLDVQAILKEFQALLALPGRAAGAGGGSGATINCCAGSWVSMATWTRC